MHAGCRCSMKERRSLNSKSRILIMLPGDLTSTSSKNTHLLQGMGTISSQLKSSTGRCRLSTGRRRLSTGSSVFLQETSCRSSGWPIIHYVGRSNNQGLAWRHASYYLHPHTLLSPLSTTPVDMQWRYLHNQRRSLSYQEKAIFKWKNAEMPYHIHPSYPIALWAWSWGHCLHSAACTRGGKTATGHPAGVP